MIDFDILFTRFILNRLNRVGTGINFQHIYDNKENKHKSNDQSDDFNIARLAYHQISKDPKQY